MTGTLLSARSLTRRFGSFTAVDGVDLAVEPGEVVGLLGANGAGKTTLIRMLLGLLHPSGGQVRLFGEPPSRRTRARLGYVPQGLGLYEDLTVAENLAFTATAFGAAEPPLDPDLEAVRRLRRRPRPQAGAAGARRADLRGGRARRGPALGRDPLGRRGSC